MGFVEFLTLIVVVAIIAAVAVWIVGQIPGTPAILPRIIWGVAVFIILIAFLRATGVLGHDLQIPHL